MKYYVRIIDESGLFIEDAFVDELTDFTVETPCPQGFYQPKWDGTVWVEGLSEEEIAELTKPTQQETTELELLMLAVAELDTQRELDRTENQVAIAELAESLLGGV